MTTPICFGKSDRLRCLSCLLLLSLTLLAAPARAELAAAMKAIERGHYATAERALRRPAAEGDAASQNNLAYLYEHGLGVAQSDVTAMSWYRRAAEAGLPAAQYNLATMLHKGRGPAGDADTSAYRWFEAAANAGYTDAEYMVGEYYRSGLGVKRDGALALSWYLKAAKKGHAGAQLMAASLYLSGEGWRSEPQKALIWAELARINGEGQASVILSRAGKSLRDEQKTEAMQQATLCLNSRYKDCPE